MDPEKAGKSTLVEVLKESLKGIGGKVVVRKQSGRAVPDESMYLNQLYQDSCKPVKDLVAIWDRSWASEYVYGTLLKQDRPMVLNSFHGEFLLGRLAQANGLRVILAGPEPSVLAERRDSSDLPVDPGMEQKLYVEYGEQYGWSIYRPESSWKDAEGLAAMIIAEFTRKILPDRPIPPYFQGDPSSETVVVASSRHGKIGVDLGKAAFKVGWVYPHQCPPEKLRYAKIFIVYDEKSYLWVKNYIGGDKQIVLTNLMKHLTLNQIMSKIEKE